MWEVPWALNEHLKRIQRERPGGSGSDDDEDVDWEDEDKWDKNELIDEVNWR